MRNARFGVLAAFAVIALICVPTVSFAQNPSPTRDRFVISARAGGVNAVTGGATVRAHGNSQWELLTIKEDLQTGDSVKTGTDGRVEMLLNPGSYLRLGENSEFELANNSLENLEIRLVRGTAIVEATGSEDSRLQINISTPHTRLAIVRRGLYRLSVVPGENTELVVRKGRVMLDRSQTKITGGNKVVFSGEAFLVAKLQKAEKKNTDALDAWSKERSETLAQANRKIRGREMGAMMATVRDRWFQNFSSGSAGFWYFNPRIGCYTFVPYFGGAGWGSPYGGYYSSSFFPGYYCGGCNRDSYYPGNYPGSGGSIAGGSGGNGGSSSPGRGSVPMTMPSEIPRPPAMEGRVLRHQDRPNN